MCNVVTDRESPRRWGACCDCCCVACCCCGCCCCWACTCTCTVRGSPAFGFPCCPCPPLVVEVTKRCCRVGAGLCWTRICCCCWRGCCCDAAAAVFDWVIIVRCVLPGAACTCTSCGCWPGRWISVRPCGSVVKPPPTLVITGRMMVCCWDW